MTPFYDHTMEEVAAMLTSGKDTRNTYVQMPGIQLLKCLRWHDNRFEVNWHPKPTLVLRWISIFFLFGALPIDTLRIKHTKKLKEIPSRDALENLPEKVCMKAFIHLKLISNLQGFYQYIMADMQIITRANYENIPGSFF